MNTIGNAGQTIAFLALSIASMLYAEDAVAAKYSFQSQQTAQCLVGALDGRVFTDTCYATRLNQQWQEIADAAGTVSYKNVSTGLCLRVVSGAMSTATCSSTEPRQDFFSYGIDIQHVHIVKIYGSTSADCFSNLSGTSVAGYAYPATCLSPALKYSWKKILR